jgi:hypothetical protein
VALLAKARMGISQGKFILPLRDILNADML